MKKTLIALTALVAATVGFQGQALADHKNNHRSAIQLDVQLGNNIGFYNVQQRNERSNRRQRQLSERNGYEKHHRYQDRHGYDRRHRCRIAGKRSIKRSLRQRGFYDIHRVRRHGRIYSAKAVSPRGHLVKLKVNGCNQRIVKRKILRSYPTVWSRNNSYRTYW